MKAHSSYCAAISTAVQKASTMNRDAFVLSCSKDFRKEASSFRESVQLQVETQNKERLEIKLMKAEVNVLMNKASLIMIIFTCWEQLNLKEASKRTQFVELTASLLSSEADTCSMAENLNTKVQTFEEAKRELKSIKDARRKVYDSWIITNNNKIISSRPLFSARI